MLRRLVLSLRYTFRRHAPRVPQRQVGVIPYAVVDGQVAVLLVTSRRTGRWIFPKGGLIDGLTPAEAAAREAFEKPGRRRNRSVPLGAYRSFKRRGTPAHRGRSLPLRVAARQEWPEKKQRRHWATVAEARKLLSEPQRRFATMLRQRL